MGRRMTRAAVGGAALFGPVAAFVLGGPLNLAAALVLSAMFYSSATWLLNPAG